MKLKRDIFFILGAFIFLFHSSVFADLKIDDAFLNALPLNKNDVNLTNPPVAIKEVTGTIKFKTGRSFCEFVNRRWDDALTELNKHYTSSTLEYIEAQKGLNYDLPRYNDVTGVKGNIGEKNLKEMGIESEILSEEKGSWIMDQHSLKVCARDDTKDPQSPLNQPYEYNFKKNNKSLSKYFTAIGDPDRAKKANEGDPETFKYYFSHFLRQARSTGNIKGADGKGISNGELVDNSWKISRKEGVDATNASIEVLRKLSETEGSVDLKLQNQQKRPSGNN